MAAIGGRNNNEDIILQHPNFKGRISEAEAKSALQQANAPAFVIRKIEGLRQIYAISILKDNRLEEHYIRPRENAFQLIILENVKDEGAVALPFATLAEVLDNLGLNRVAAGRALPKPAASADKGKPEVLALDMKELEDALEQRAANRSRAFEPKLGKAFYTDQILHHPFFRSVPENNALSIHERERDLNKKVEELLRKEKLPFLYHEDHAKPGSYRLSWLSQDRRDPNKLVSPRNVTFEPTDSGFNVVFLGSLQQRKNSLGEVLKVYGLKVPEAKEDKEAKSMVFSQKEEPAKAPEEPPHWPLEEEEKALIEKYIAAVPHDEEEGLTIDPIYFTFMSDPVTLIDPKNPGIEKAGHTFNRKTLQDLLLKKTPAADPLNPNFLFTEANFGPPKKESKEAIQALLRKANEWERQQAGLKRH